MKIQYLGTAAAEGIPAIFCDCEACRKSRELGGRNFRTRSQAIIDDTILIDFPADTYMHFLQHNVPMTKIKTCLITHSHQDHLYPEDFLMRVNGFAHIENKQPLTVYSDESGYEMTVKIKKEHSVDDNTLLAVKLEAGKRFEAEDYSILPIRAAHDPRSTPVLFVIEKGGKSIFYANDSSEYPEESMNALRTLEKPLDVVSLDCTNACNKERYIGHLGLEQCCEVRDMLVSEGIADKDTKFVVNHFSHNGANVVYDEFVGIAEKHGFITSYDGMTLEF